MKPLVQVRSVSKQFDRTFVFQDVSFDILVGDHLALIGESGSGKSTLLRLLAGLDTLTAGEIQVEDRLVSVAEKTLVPPHKRRVALVFQDLALWPNLTAFENVILGMAQAKMSHQERRVEALAALRACRLDNLAHRKPESLSAGQQQRIALARAIAVRPRLLLLDEPFTGLDVIVKLQLFEEIKSLCGNFGATLLVVTHDPLEAAALCRKAVVIEGGQIKEKGPLKTLLDNPSSAILKALVVQLEMRSPIKSRTPQPLSK
jgi:ABC-type Fe3+/spermidine/putrescine transport system ATPase subunit